MSSVSPKSLNNSQTLNTERHLPTYQALPTYAHPEHLVIILSGPVCGRQILIWDTQQPMPVGFPFQWILERSTKGVLVRSVATRLEVVTSGAACEISNEQISKGISFNLPLSSDQKKGKKRGFQTIQIQNHQPIAAAFTARERNAKEELQKGRMMVYTCLGEMIVDTQALGQNFRAGSRKSAVFQLKHSEEEYQITAQSDDLQILKSSRWQSLSKNQSVSLDNRQLMDCQIRHGLQKWHFNWIEDTHYTPSSDLTVDADSQSFKKYLRNNLIGLTVVALLLMLIPKPEVTEPEKENIIPAQYAKVILKKQPSSAEAPSSAGGPAPVEKIQHAKQSSVAKAFRSKALSNTVSKLMKGGMSRLMAQTNLVTNTGQGALFEQSKTADVREFAIQGSDRKEVTVASLGGQGSGGDKVGYGSGKRAGLSGQGSSYVGLDTQGYDVQEGLTKDEVGRVIHAHLSEIRYCYESAMLGNPDIAGKLLVDFTIGASGFVSTSTVAQSSLGAPRLDDCVLRRLGKWKFPKPKGGVNVAVSYPFIFKSIGR